MHGSTERRNVEFEVLACEHSLGPLVWDGRIPDPEASAPPQARAGREDARAEEPAHDDC